MKSNFYFNVCNLIMKMNGGFTVVKLTGYAIVYNLQLEQRRGGRGNFLQVVGMYVQLYIQSKHYNYTKM